MTSKGRHVAEVFRALCIFLVAAGPRLPGGATRPRAAWDRRTARGLAARGFGSRCVHDGCRGRCMSPAAAIGPGEVVSRGVSSSVASHRDERPDDPGSDRRGTSDVSEILREVGQGMWAPLRTVNEAMGFIRELQRRELHNRIPDVVASMEADGLMVPAEAYAALMRSFLVMHRPSMALQAWRTYLRRGFRPTTSLYHMALAAMGRLSLHEDAFRLLDSIAEVSPPPSPLHFSQMLLNIAMVGDWSMVQRLEAKMSEMGVKADENYLASMIRMYIWPVPGRPWEWNRKCIRDLLEEAKYVDSAGAVFAGAYVDVTRQPKKKGQDSYMCLLAAAEVFGKVGDKAAADDLVAQSVSVPMPSKVEETMLTWRMLAVACGVRVIRARMALHGLALGYAVPGLRTGTDEDAARGGDEAVWGSTSAMDVAAWGGVGPPRLTGWKAHLAHQRGRGGDLAANLGGQMQLPLPPRVEVDRALRERSIPGPAPPERLHQQLWGARDAGGEGAEGRGEDGLTRALTEAAETAQARRTRQVLASATSEWFDAVDVFRESVEGLPQGAPSGRTEWADMDEGRGMNDSEFPMSTTLLSLVDLGLDLMERGGPDEAVEPTVVQLLGLAAGKRDLHLHFFVATSLIHKAAVRARSAPVCVALFEILAERGVGVTPQAAQALHDRVREAFPDDKRLIEMTYNYMLAQHTRRPYAPRPADDTAWGSFHADRGWPTAARALQAEMDK